jgi:hypothetical protein
MTFCATNKEINKPSIEQIVPMKFSNSMVNLRTIDKNHQVGKEPERGGSSISNSENVAAT